MTRCGHVRTLVRPLITLVKAARFNYDHRKRGLKRLKSARYLSALILFSLFFAGCESSGITWHSYVHPSGQIRYDLHLTNYKRGIFFGSCGPSTYSLQWEYRIELKGAGPNYTGEEIELQDGTFHRIPVASGSILLDGKKQSAKIDISVLQDSNSIPFTHNGTYAMKKES